MKISPKIFFVGEKKLRVAANLSKDYVFVCFSACLNIFCSVGQPVKRSFVHSHHNSTEI